MLIKLFLMFKLYGSTSEANQAIVMAKNLYIIHYIITNVQLVLKYYMFGL